MTRTVSGLAIAAALIVCRPCLGQAAAPRGAAAENAEESPEVQPKFIWGIVIKYVAGEVFSAFSQWVMAKVSEKYGLNLPARDSGGSFGMEFAKLAVASLRQKSDTTGGARIVSSPVAVSSREAPQITLERPSTPIKLDDGGPNYQGVHIAIVGADRSGNITELRSVKGGFRTGERFKLRAVSTFGGLLVIDNINPKGERRQIYPAQAGAVIVLQPGADTLLPLGKDQFFEFARATGEEQLVISLRDPRAVGAAASRSRVHRKDEEYGSHFMQEVSKDSFPVISESIRLEHH